MCLRQEILCPIVVIMCVYVCTCILCVDFSFSVLRNNRVYLIVAISSPPQTGVQKKRYS